MFKKTILSLLTVLFVSGLISACSGNKTAEQTEVPANQSVRPTPPAEYAGNKNPYAGDENAIEVGKSIYNTNCSPCHGESGMGDGPAAASLNPKPQPLAMNQNFLGDDYMYWRIAEGGSQEPFKSTMPAWKGVLEPGEIWQIVTYLHTFK